MTYENYEIVIKYSQWEIDILDENANKIVELKSISKNWFSKNVSGKFMIDNTGYEIIYNQSGASVVKDGNREIGQVTFSTFGSFGYGRIANINIEDINVVLTRQNLKQIFVLTNAISQKLILKIDGKFYPDKQRNLFKFFYFDNKQFHSVTLNEAINRATLLLILVICGYCIRFFLEIDSR